MTVRSCRSPATTTTGISCGPRFPTRRGSTPARQLGDVDRCRQRCGSSGSIPPFPASRAQSSTTNASVAASRSSPSRRRRHDPRAAPSAVRDRRRLDGRVGVRRPRSARSRARPSPRRQGGLRALPSTGLARRSPASPSRSGCRPCNTSTSISHPGAGPSLIIDPVGYQIHRVAPGYARRDAQPLHRHARNPPAPSGSSPPGPTIF